MSPGETPVWSSPARRQRRLLASFYSLESPLWAPLHTPANVPGRKLESRLDGRRRRQVRRVLLGGAAWGRLVLWGCVQQCVGGRLVSIESLWLGSSFTSATLPAAYPLRLAAFGVCGVAVVCAPTCGRAPWRAQSRDQPLLKLSGERLCIRRCGAFEPRRGEGIPFDVREGKCLDHLICWFPPCVRFLAGAPRGCTCSHIGALL